MTDFLCESPAGLVAIYIAANRAGDRMLASSARAQLLKQYDIHVELGDEHMRLHAESIEDRRKRSER